MRSREALSRGELIRLAEQQQALLSELVAARERDRAALAALRTANERARVEIAELRADREQARATNEQVQARVRELAAKLAQLEKGGPQGMPGHTPARPAAKPAAKPAAGSRTGRAHGAGRVRSAPTRPEIPTAEQCPDCGTALSGGSVKRTREVIELIPSPAAIVEPVVVERRCPRCRRRGVPPRDLGEQVVGPQRLGAAGRWVAGVDRHAA